MTSLQRSITLKRVDNISSRTGNARVVANQNGEVEQVNHYYPYGGLMGESTSSDHQPYKYNGKELDHHHGLDWYDYGARWFNGYSWTTPDPLAENYREVSPYMYCLGNPIKYIDPDGREIWIHYINADGNSESFLYSPGMTCTTDFDGSLGGPTYRRLGYSRGEIKQNPLIKIFYQQNSFYE